MPEDETLPHPFQPCEVHDEIAGDVPRKQRVKHALVHDLRVRPHLRGFRVRQLPFHGLLFRPRHGLEQVMERPLLVVEQIRPGHEIRLRPELVQEPHHPPTVLHEPHPTVYPVVIRGDDLIHGVVRDVFELHVRVHDQRVHVDE
eukprot:30294-Pelagococcus_subviridis.AAC.9